MRIKRNRGKTDGTVFTIRNKILAVSLAIALGTTLVSLAISYYAEINTIKSITEKYTMQYISSADKKFHEMLLEARKILLAVASETGVIAPDIISSLDEASYEEYQSKKKIKSFLTSLISQKEYIDNILVVVDNGRIYQANTELIMQKDLQQNIVREALGAEKIGLWHEPGSEELWMNCPVFFRGVRSGTVLMSLNYEKLTDVWALDGIRDVNIYIYESNGNIFYMNTNIKKSEKEVLQKVLENRNTSGEIYLGGERYYFISYGAGEEKMTTISILPLKVLFENIGELRNKFLVIGILAGVSAFIASFYLSGRLCGNLKSLTESMEEVRKGNLNIHSEIRSRDEVGILATSFNEMMDRIRILLEEVKIRERLKREAERDVLATQIEPHFLYNTIDSIQYVAHMREEKEIEQVASALSELLRSVLSNHDECITLWEEKEYIENYMLIERFKYREEFDLIWDVDETLWGMQIPKLLLQPIVENALLHGIAGKASDGIIQVKGYREKDGIVLKIMDNGKGMTKEYLEQLRKEVTRTDKAGFRRVGIANVFSRIRLLYGENYGGTIYSCEDMFTCVELRLPG